MSRYQIWDHWTKLGEVSAFNPDHALKVFRSERRGHEHIRLFAYFA